MGRKIKGKNKMRKHIQRKYDLKEYNGRILNDVHLPTEMILEIFSHLDTKELIPCSRVCDYWNDIVKNYLYRKRANDLVKTLLEPRADRPWQFFYLLSIMPFGRNLIKNPSGEYGLKHWAKNDRVTEPTEYVLFEHDPQGIDPFPDDPILEGKKYCFKTFVMKYITPKFRQDICFAAQGFTPEFMDRVRPKIKVSVWFNQERSTAYEATFGIFNENRRPVRIENFRAGIDPSRERTGQWVKFEHIFENYPAGVRWITLYQFAQGVTRSAGANVEVILPENVHDLTIHDVTNEKELL